ncbi:MAG TPA: hypothetical protein VJ748_01410, partial [Vitreimonas sp.]|nr:hypothetical protein [Vitreimonas sp.]
HLLDSDDVLQPDAIERKVAAFVAIADADLCFSTVIEHNLSGALTPKVLPPDGSERCATQDLLAVAARRYPFFLSTVMMPRWAMLAARLFEEDLRRGEDSRFFFTIALRGGKAIGFAEPLTVRRVVKDRLSQVPHTGANAIAIRRRNLRDTLSVPAAWHFTSTIVRVLVRNLNNATALSNAARATVFEELTPAIAALGDGQSRAGLSPVMVLAELRNALAAGKDTLHADWHNTWRALDAAASTALASAARLTSADIAHWGVKTSRDRRRTFVGPLCRALLKQAARDPDVIRRIDPVLRHACPSPARESVRHYRLLRRGLRSSQLAAWLAWPTAYWPRAR